VSFAFTYDPQTLESPGDSCSSTPSQIVYPRSKWPREATQSRQSKLSIWLFQLPSPKLYRIRSLIISLLTLSKSVGWVASCFDVNLMLFHTALSGDAPPQRLSSYLPTLPTTHSIAVFVGAMARGKDDFADGYVDDKISISDYPLSASVACGKVDLGHLLLRPWFNVFAISVLLCVGRTLGYRLISLAQSSFYHALYFSTGTRLCISTRRLPQRICILTTSATFTHSVM
jgi:EMG1/NEP1 methyltransferase